MCKPIFVSNLTELGKVMLWLELRWGCDNIVVVVVFVVVVVVNFVVVALIVVTYHIIFSCGQ